MIKILALGWCLLIFTALIQPVLADSPYFFQEEFNSERADNTLDSTKWDVYPNSSGTTIKETTGNLVTTQSNFTNQYPMVVSKNPALPTGDFEASISLQYTHVTPWGTGIALSETKPPIPGNDFGGLLALSVWQDNNAGLEMRLQYHAQIVFTTPINTNPHIFKVVRQGLKYYLYLDNNLAFTSPDNPVQVRYIWMGNPSFQVDPIPDWTKFNVNYVRITDNSSAPPLFLDLPFNKKSLSFNDASTAMTSYFDHQYPLLSSGLPEPFSNNQTIIQFDNSETKNPYSSHDGYDYAKKAGVNMGDPVLAAAAGVASRGDPQKCLPCGNYILIDHGNGYQTRYFHLQPDELIVGPGQSVNVTTGQQIGKVGATGNVFPPGEAGAHIHFMVVQDKNRDGNFDDNIPDGVTDPFGWQSSQPDPWPIFNFNYLGKARTGNTSFYLWKEKLDNLDASLTSNGGVFKTSRFNVNFPSQTTNQNLELLMDARPTGLNGLLSSIGSAIEIRAVNDQGNFIKNFNNIITITEDFSGLDLSRIKLSTLGFYSSPDGNTWTKEPTTVDLNSQTATTQVNHLTFFALMAEPADSIPPTTTANLSGTPGPSWFRSDVTASLTAQDNDGGLGVDYTMVKVDDSDWQQYSSPITITSEGHHTIGFYSVDKGENTEIAKQVSFDIDKTNPEVQAMFNLTTRKTEITGLDSNTLQTQNPQVGTKTFIDLAGNSTQVDFNQTSKNFVDTLGLKDILYSGSQLNFPPNQFIVLFSYNPLNNKTYVLNQDILIKGVKIVSTIYNPFTNKTKVYHLDKGGQWISEDKIGMILVKLTTQNGQLVTSY